jgi:WD40 repeat protein
MPGGAVQSRRKVPGLVYTCRFSPDGRRLAYSGGTSQGIFVQDTRAPRTDPTELRGQGTTIFDLGFTADSQSIGFTRERFAPASSPQLYDGFDLARRRYQALPGNPLRRAIKQYNGWTLSGSILRYRLEAVNVDGRRLPPFDLDPSTERNWWSYTFIPPGPDHPRPTVAVGCESGVVIYDLETGRRTRMFAGHSSPVVSVVSSPDGRWLASSSIDQTIMIYPLAGCDTRPGFGATFQRQANGSWVVASVKPRGFAAAMGLQVSDVIVKAGIASNRTATRDIYERPDQIGTFVSRVDDLAPGHYLIGIYVRRTVRDPIQGEVARDLPPMPSTKRNNPVMTLLLDTDREWVLWTPQGYYDTSIAGDTRLLGWQLNPPHDQARATDYVPIGTYAATMHRPEVLDQLWRTGDLDQALAALPAGAPPEQPVLDEQPPQIAFAATDARVKPPTPGAVWEVGVPQLRIRLTISSQGKSRVGDRQVVFDERLMAFPPIREPVATVQEDVPVELPPQRRVRLLVKASNVNNRSRSEFIDLLYAPPPPPEREAKPPAAPEVRRHLVVLSIGNEQSLNPELLPPVRFADKDAQRLAGFLPKHLLASIADRSLPELLGNAVVLTGGMASASSIIRAFDDLRKLLETRQLQPGDVVAVTITAHVLEVGKTTLITTADTDPVRPQELARSALSARELSDRLGELTDYGCRVILFLDGIHALPEGEYACNIKPWVRDLWLERRVITFLASKEGPSGFDVPAQHRYFTLGLLRALGAVQSSPAAPYSLEKFKTAVVQEVLNLSGRRQEVGCYVPRAVSLGINFALP